MLRRFGEGQALSPRSRSSHSRMLSQGALLLCCTARFFSDGVSASVAWRKSAAASPALRLGAIWTSTSSTNTAATKNLVYFSYLRRQWKHSNHSSKYVCECEYGRYLWGGRGISAQFWSQRTSDWQWLNPCVSVLSAVSHRFCDFPVGSPLKRCACISVPCSQTTGCVFIAGVRDSGLWRVIDLD